MPLSERERRILDEIEKNLYQEDPRFAGGLRRPATLQRSTRRRLGSGLFAAGFALLIAFFVTGRIVLGVLAFGTMVTGMVLVAGSISDSSGDEEGNRERPADAVRRALGRWESKARKRKKRS